MERLTIHLAGNQFTIGPLSIGQLEELHVGVLEPPVNDPQENARQLWKRNRAIIVAALSLDHPEITLEVLTKMRVGNAKTLAKIVDSILAFSGLIDEKPKESAPGESVAGTAE